MGLWTDIVGSVRGYIRLGLTGVRLKNSSGALAVRNAGDSAYAKVECDSIELGHASDTTLTRVSAGVVAVEGVTIGAPTGSVLDYVGSTAPPGYVLLSGRTIGDAASGGTERANADTEALFTLLWNSMSNTEAAVSGGRGGSAAADFAAHKTIALPDARGRVVVGKDNMGGTTASRITAAGSGITGTTLGTSGGAETHTLTEAQLAVHTHTTSYPGRGYSPSGGGTYGITINTYNQANDNTLADAGSGQAHNNTQPSLVLNKIIKL